jgi:hypothetical protein
MKCSIKILRKGYLWWTIFINNNSKDKFKQKSKALRHIKSNRKMFGISHSGDIPRLFKKSFWASYEDSQYSPKLDTFWSDLRYVHVLVLLLIVIDLRN